MHHSEKNISFTDIANQLFHLRQDMLLLKAALLAYNEGFHEYVATENSESPYDFDETAEYFIHQFFDKNPEEKLSEVIQELWELKAEVDLSSNRFSAPDFKSLL